MTDLERLVAAILADFLEYLDEKEESGRKVDKRLDNPSVPSIACNQGGLKDD